MREDEGARRNGRQWSEENRDKVIEDADTHGIGVCWLCYAKTTRNKNSDRHCSSAPSRLPDRLVGLDRAHATAAEQGQTRPRCIQQSASSSLLLLCWRDATRMPRHVHGQALFQRRAARPDSGQPHQTSSGFVSIAHSVRMSTRQLVNSSTRRACMSYNQYRGCTTRTQTTLICDRRICKLLIWSGRELAAV
jgi:hypothetical protein